MVTLSDAGAEHAGRLSSKELGKHGAPLVISDIDGVISAFQNVAQPGERSMLIVAFGYLLATSPPFSNFSWADF